MSRDKRYGYDKRPDMPDRFVTGPEATPRNEWPRGLAQAVRNPAGGGIEKQVLSMFTAAGVAVIAGYNQTALTSTNFDSTSVETTNGWWAAINRHAKLVDLTGTSATARGVRRIELYSNLSPIGLFGPTGGAFPVVIRMSDALAAMTTVPAASHLGGVSFGLNNYDPVPQTSYPPDSFIGFAAEWAAPDTFGEWKTYIANNTGSYTRSRALGFYTNAPHLLEVEFHGGDRVIRWWVDGAMVDEFTPVYADNHLFTDDYLGMGGGSIEYRVDVSASNAATTRLAHLMDSIPYVSVELTDLDGTEY